jgi:alpha-L-fucosidase
VKRFSVDCKPYADALDTALFKVERLSPSRLLIDLGRQTAVRGLALKAAAPELVRVVARANRRAASVPACAAEGSGLRLAGGPKADGSWSCEFHNVQRTRYLTIDTFGCAVAPEQVVLDVVPYGWMKRLSSETPAEKCARMKWWTDARFGLFIHFGLYALPARHEWLRTTDPVPAAKYREYFDNFNPDKLDARAWAKAAKAAGMKYAVLTAKHHEGFCLFDSKHTDFKSTKTPFGRDIVREFVDAFRAEGLKVGFYYSVIDWHHPDFTLDAVHADRKGKFWDCWNDEKNHGEINKTRDMDRYRRYMKDQVTELLTEYGRIDILWFDFSYVKERGGKGRDDWDSAGLIALARRLQPHILIDNRLDMDDWEDGWDFRTPEQNREPACVTFAGRKVPWETCQTFSGSWGYYRDEKTWKTTFQIVEQLIDTVSKGGNVIMNVGPTGRGEFDHRALARLADYGKWLHENGESMYGCTEAPEGFVAPPGTALTYNPGTNKLYLHLFAWPWGGVNVPFASEVKYAQLLNDKSEVSLSGGMLALPVDPPPTVVPVVEFTLK